MSDWSYCREALKAHSRTFALPIGMLPQPLERVVTCAYLLCRIADTVEDTPSWSLSDKERMFRVFLDVLAGSSDVSEFERHVRDTPGGDEAERELLLNTHRVLSAFSETEPTLQQHCRDWIAELTRGMSLYSHRRPGPDGVTCLESPADLERYCYFVAGTIGRLLTEAFIAEERVGDAVAVAKLRALSERFGSALQLVNILRDITADLQRNWCFIPRSLLSSEGLEPRSLTSPESAPRVRKALGAVFAQARRNLEDALEYVLTLPTHAIGARRFCLTPLLLAVATLELCQQDARLLMPGERVKLGRGHVLQLIQQSTAIAADNTALRKAFRDLAAPSPG